MGTMTSTDIVLAMRLKRVAMTDRLVTLSVQPKAQIGEKYALDIFNDFTMDPGIRAMYSSVNVSSYNFEELEPSDEEEELAGTNEDYYDDQTIRKVVEALMVENFTSHGAENVIRIIQNAGILFRERR